MRPGELMGLALDAARHAEYYDGLATRDARERAEAAMLAAGLAGSAVGHAFRALEDTYERGRREERERIVRALRRVGADIYACYGNSDEAAFACARDVLAGLIECGEL